MFFSFYNITTPSTKNVNTYTLHLSIVVLVVCDGQFVILVDCGQGSYIQPVYQMYYVSLGLRRSRVKRFIIHEVH